MQKYGYGKKLLISFFIGLIGVVLYLLPFGLALDEKFGLNVLFHLRGVTSAPSDVIVIAIDQYSASKLKDNNQIANNTIDPSKWPRALHAELIDRLIEEEVKVIAFDLRFRGCGSGFEDNDRLVQAIKNAGNVILVEELVDSRDIADLPYQMDEQPEVCNFESLSTKDLNRDEPHQYHFSESIGLHGAWHRSVLPMISDAAQATAPFVLPRGVVTYHWTFKEDAGGIPLLPAVVLQIFAQDIYDQFAHILQEIDPVAGLNVPSTLDKGIEIEALMYELRGQFIEKPALKDQFINALNQNDEIDTQTKGKLQALAELYAGHEKHYLNFYGPPRSIRTIPYYQILNQDRLQDQRVDLRGKAVFVGVSAAKFGEQDKLRDDYTTVFKQPDGLQISGVEIAATAFANLLENKTLHPINEGYGVILVFLLGFMICVFYFALPYRIVFFTVILFLLIYYFLAYQLFETKHLWVPLVIPLIQAGLGFGIALSLKYVESNQQKERLQQAFGKYVPDKVVNDFIHNSGLATTRGQQLYGICMDTDADRYTELSEKMRPTELMVLMNEYYSRLFEPVKAREGLISDVKGDAMLAIWTEPNFSKRQCEQACRAALEIIDAVESFNQSHPDTVLPTRIGLHIGEVVVGNVGTVDHYEYRAVGDLVNSANRIQSANKHFQTRILLSTDVLEGLDLFLIRPLGSVLLHGKSNPINLAELINFKAKATDDQIWLCEAFAKVIQAYEVQNWIVAKQDLFEILEKFPNDGPSRFFLNRCETYLKVSPVAWDAITYLSGK